MHVETLMELLEACPAEAEVRIAVPLFPAASSTILAIANPHRRAQLRGDLRAGPGRIWILATPPNSPVEGLVWSDRFRVRA